MSPLMKSANSDILRLIISMGTALAKVVLNPNRKWARNPELKLVGDRPTYTTYGMMESARRKCPCVNTGTFARSVEDHTAWATVLEEKLEALERRGHHPQFAHQLIWDSDVEEMGPTKMYSLTAEPPLRLPPSTFTETSLKTISDNPDLFKITCLIYIDVLDSLLVNHPKPLFLVYIDNIVIFSKTFDNHLDHLDQVFKAVAETGITLTTTKCHFAYQSLLLLGQKVSRLGLSTHMEKVSAILNLEALKNIHDLQIFLGMMWYFSAYIPFYAWIAALPVSRHWSLWGFLAMAR